MKIKAGGGSEHGKVQSKRGQNEKDLSLPSTAKTNASRYRASDVKTGKSKLAYLKGVGDVVVFNAGGAFYATLQLSGPGSNALTIRPSSTC